MHSDKVRELVGAYCALYGMPDCIVHDLAAPSAIWRDGGDAGGHGCYAIYNQQGHLRYIGSSKTIRRRSCSHFAPKVQACRFWHGNPAAFVQLIETREPWEHWSLEAYLTIKTEALRKESELPTSA